MELEMKDVLARLEACIAALTTAVGSVQAAASQTKEVPEEYSRELRRITAAVDYEENKTLLANSSRESDLARRLDEAENALATLQESGARCGKQSIARKTLPAATVQLLAKQGINADTSVALSDLDAALAGLSVEHRFAVKSQLLRTGATVL